MRLADAAWLRHCFGSTEHAFRRCPADARRKNARCRIPRMASRLSEGGKYHNLGLMPWHPRQTSPAGIACAMKLGGPQTPRHRRKVHAAGCRRMKLARYRQDRGRVRSAVFGKRRLGLTYCIAWRQVSGWLRGRWREHMDAWWHTVGTRIVLG